jgi:hypothetical protein
VSRQARALYDAGIRFVMYPADYMARSHGYIADGLTLQCARWRTHPHFFRPLRAFLTQRLSGPGAEWVIVYEVRPPPKPA